MPDEVMPPKPPESTSGTTPPAGAGGTWPPAGEVTKDEKTMAMIAWLLSGLTFIVPLIIFLLKKDEGRFVRYHALQSLFFSLIAMGATLITCGVLWPVGIIVGIVWGLKVKEGKWEAMPVVDGWSRGQ